MNLLGNLYGNPHSDSDPAQFSGRAVEETRKAALVFFGADPKDFDLIFTANATAAIKLVGESFRDLAAAGTTTGSFFYGYHRDAHTSLVGVRELTSGTHHCFTSDEEVEEWLNGDGNRSRVSNHAGLPGLFAYPGQSNMNGRRLPLSWAKKLRQSTKPHHQNAYSLLDAAALATTTQLDFSDPESAPDFTALSFYKIFGFPDLGALIVRKKSGHILSWRRYFGGGTISMLTVMHNPIVRRKDGSLHEALEDGTLPFHSVIALGCAIEVHKKLYGSMRTISMHTSYLARCLYAGLSSLRHCNGNPVCIIYIESEGLPYQDSTTQGATVAFSVVRQDGTYIAHSVVEKLANQEGIYVRSGGLCNAGGLTQHLRIEPWQFSRNWSSGFRCGGDESLTEIINGKPTGVVRVSLGAMSTLADVNTFLDFMVSTFETKSEISKAVESISFDLSQDIARVIDQPFSYEGDLLQRSDSGFHSHSGASTVSLTPPIFPMVKKVSSMSNLGYEQQRQNPRPRRSQETLHTGNTRRRAARMLLPVPVQQDLEQPFNFQQRIPMQTIELNNNRLLYSDYDHRHHQTIQELAGSGEQDPRGKQEKRGRFRLWRSKKSM